MGFYLALKEMWRSRGRFVLFSLVIALITTLVLFVAALGEGLGSGNREYLEKLNGELVVYADKSDLLIPSSSIRQSELARIRRVDGVNEVGPIGFSNVIITAPAGDLKVALIGVEPGKPGEPPVVSGRQLQGREKRETILDRNVAIRTGLAVGDIFSIRSTQGTEEETYEIRVVGISDGRQYSLQPSVIVPFRTWDRIRPQPSAVTSQAYEPVANIVAVQLDRPEDVEVVRQRLQSEVPGILAVDRVTAYESTPGYSAQQSTLNTQRYFALMIGVLVIGGFFQIQTLQKVPQIGVLKAIGASNFAVGLAAVTQIILVTLLGVGTGSALTLALSLGFPPTIPIVFSANSLVVAIASLLLIGPLGGLVSVRYSLRIEPLTALGLSS